MQRRLLAVIAKAARDLCRAALGDKLPGYTRFHSSLEIETKRCVAFRIPEWSKQNMAPRMLEHRDVSGILITTRVRYGWRNARNPEPH